MTCLTDRFRPDVVATAVDFFVSGNFLADFLECWITFWSIVFSDRLSGRFNFSDGYHLMCRTGRVYVSVVDMLVKNCSNCVFVACWPKNRYGCCAMLCDVV